MPHFEDLQIIAQEFEVADVIFVNMTAFQTA